MVRGITTAANVRIPSLIQSRGPSEVSTGWSVKVPRGQISRYAYTPNTTSRTKTRCRVANLLRLKLPTTDVNARTDA